MCLLAVSLVYGAVEGASVPQQREVRAFKWWGTELLLLCRIEFHSLLILCPFITGKTAILFRGPGAILEPESTEV